MNQNTTVWGPKHLFTTTPKWASKAVSVVLSLNTFYGALLLQYPNLIPSAWQAYIATGLGVIAWVFQSFGLIPTTGATSQANELPVESGPSTTGQKMW